MREVDWSVSVVAAQDELDLPADCETVAPEATQPKTAEPETAEPVTVVGSAGPASERSARIGVGCFVSRYAGAMLLNAFTDRVGASGVFAAAATPRAGRRFDDVAILSAVSTVFGLGFASMEQAKHPDRAQVGPVAGITVLPELRTLRPRLAAIADGCDPLGLQRAFATAMLTADPCTSGGVLRR